ncbi:MAG: hypothetical protein MRY74_17125 [Neomegalonema sp.]|nr:hypothetical protein [Neomegalonema sp.]
MRNSSVAVSGELGEQSESRAVAQIDVERLSAFVDGLEKLLALVGRNAAVVADNVASASEEPISALAHVDKIATTSARNIKTKQSDFDADATEATSQPGLALSQFAERSRSFGRDVVDISHTHSETISEKVEATLTSAQMFDLARQQTAALAKMAQFGQELAADFRIVLAGSCQEAPVSAPGVDLGELSKFYVSDVQRKIHGELLGDQPEEEAAADTIEFF